MIKRNKKTDIVFAGNLIVDHIKEIITLPNRSELTKILSVRNSTGGAVCNSGIDLAILDKSIKISAVGIVGDDNDGDFVINELKKYDIDTSNIKKQGITAFTDVFAEKSTNARTFMYYGGASDEFDVDTIDVDNLDCDIIHVGYLLLMDKLDSFDDEYGTRLARLLSKIQKKGIKTSIDIVSEDGNRFEQVVIPALKYLDYLTINEIEAEKTTGIALRNADGEIIYDNMSLVLNKLFDLGVKERVIIHYPEGASGLDKTGEYARVFSNKLPKGYIVGSVGAGDAFCAGTLLGALKKADIKTALTYGTASAQISLKDSSASGGMRCLEETLNEYYSMRK